MGYSQRFYYFPILIFCLGGLPMLANVEVEKWGRFEVTLEYAYEGNPFTEVALKAVFSNGKEASFSVEGFYDGDDQFRIRFMPQLVGTWSYVTQSNVPALHDKKGSFTCIPPLKNNHGMVQVSEVTHFKYQDGRRYFPFGTTAYAWTHMDDELQKMTLQTLQQSGFNKVRMCVMPKSYALVEIEPQHFPFLIQSSTKNSEGIEKRIWDFEKFNPEFFQRLEKRVAQLDELGVEADLIIFHPYDKGRWGFDAMPQEVDVRYVKYLVARLSSFRNVWWSLANEWDYLQAKTKSEWNNLISTVVEADPYGHLCSIHGSTASYFEYWKPEITHVSIQDEAPVQSLTAAATLTRIFKKPVIFDEVGYEGNLTRRWGRLSPEAMMHLVWNGVMGGAYVSHGETYTYYTEGDTIFWANGGQMRGQSWKRIKFLREIVEQLSAPLSVADISRDFYTSSAGEGKYFVYFGKEIQEFWQFNLPAKNVTFQKLQPNTKFKVEIIDAWEMTITEVPIIFETGAVNDYRLFDKQWRKIRLPQKPYLALRITQLVD